MILHFDQKISSILDIRNKQGQYEIQDLIDDNLLNIIMLTRPETRISFTRSDTLSLYSLIVIADGDMTIDGTLYHNIAVIPNYELNEVSIYGVVKLRYLALCREYFHTNEFGIELDFIENDTMKQTDYKVHYGSNFPILRQLKLTCSYLTYDDLYAIIDVYKSMRKKIGVITTFPLSKKWTSMACIITDKSSSRKVNWGNDIFDAITLTFTETN